jgi:hypothetical protein
MPLILSVKNTSQIFVRSFRNALPSSSKMAVPEAPSLRQVQVKIVCGGVSWSLMGGVS